MVKSQNGGNKDGVGYYEMVNLAMRHPVKYYFVMGLVKLKMYRVVKKILGVD